MWGPFDHLGTSSLISQSGHLLVSFQMEVMFQTMHSDLWRTWLSHSTLFTEIIVIKCHNDIKLFRGTGEFLLWQWLLTERRFPGLDGHELHQNESQKLPHKKRAQW